MDFRDEVQIERAAEAGGDPWGDYSTPEVIQKKCRIDYSSKLVRNQRGEEVVSDVRNNFV